MSDTVNNWRMTQTPSGIGAGFAMPASAGLVAPSTLVSYDESARDRHAVATKQHPGTLVWSPPT